MNSDFPRPPIFVGAQHESHMATAEQALRANRRYVLEVIEGLGFCPWAEPARVQGRVQEVVVTDALTPEDFFTHADAWAADTSVEVVLVVFATSALSRADHEHFARALREFDAARTVEHANTFAFAAFHPDAEADTKNAQRLVPFLRSSPYPTFQLVRRSVLDALRQERDAPRYVDPARVDLRSVAEAPQRKDLHERIAEANLATVERVGVDSVRRKLDEIKPRR